MRNPADFTLGAACVGYDCAGADQIPSTAQEVGNSADRRSQIDQIGGAHFEAVEAVFNPINHSAGERFL
jgi:hypothetical protein